MKNIIIFLSCLTLLACAKTDAPKTSDSNKTEIDVSDRKNIKAAVSIEEENDLTDEAQRLSYALGAYFGSQLSVFNELQLPFFLAGLQHAYNEKGELVMNQQQISQTIVSGQQKILRQAGASALEEGEQFLVQNGKKEGVVTLDNGIQYRILTEGSGKKPKASDTVEVHYEGSLVSGDVFDSSYQRNATAVFPLEGVIDGWQEVLPLMPTGSVWEVAIPPNLAYGEQGSGRIGPNAVLVFKIELVDIVVDP